MKAVGVIFAFTALLSSTLFAQDQDTTAVTADTTPNATIEPPAPPARQEITLFKASQIDSLLNLMPGGDSIRQNCQVVGIGKDMQTGDLVVIVLDAFGDPKKLMVPAPALRPSTVTLITPAPKKLEQDGRTWFIIESTIKSAFVYPFAYGAIVPNDSGENGRTIGGLSLLTIGGMLYGSYAFTKNMELGYGKVALMNFGSTALGGQYPTLLATLLHNVTRINDSYKRSDTLWDGNIVERYEGPTATDQIRAWISVVGFPLGAYLGSRQTIIDKEEFGKASLMSYFSQTFGALAFALPVFYYDDPGDRDSRHYYSASSGLSMCLLPVGFYTGYWLTRDKEISAGRGIMPVVTGFGGALTGLGLAMLGDEYHGIASTRAILAATIAGYAGGTWFGLNYHPQIDYTFWQTVFIGSSVVAGTFVGLSLPLIADASSRRSYILACIGGGWAGFYFGERLSLQLFEKSNRDKKKSALHISLPGLAALPVLFSLPESGRSGSAYQNVPALPMANLEWRF